MWIELEYKYYDLIQLFRLVRKTNTTVEEYFNIIYYRYLKNIFNYIIVVFIIIM